MTRIRFVAETGSTNADLLADRQAVEGDWLVANRQTGGRGRQGRAWQSLGGNFSGSTLIVLRASDPPPQTLALAAGLALVEAVDAAAPGRELLLKWPNDLLLGGAKLAGILLERSGDRIVAGFGVNLADAPAIPGRPTASLDRAIAPRAFAPLLAASMARMVDAWRRCEPSALAELWQERGMPVGTPIAIHGGDGQVERGSFGGIVADGAMILTRENGSSAVIHAGDVELG